MKKIILCTCILIYIAFPGQAQRINTTINTGWKFHIGDTSLLPGKQVPQNWETINVPHTWNDKDAFDEVRGYYRGIGWYMKELRIPTEWKGKRVFIHFEGVNQETDVFINGRHTGNHKGGYTAFNFDISDQLDYGQKNVLSVKVDNKHDKNIPPLNADFTFYGGIYRNVRLIVSAPVHFDITDNASDGIFIETPSVAKDHASLRISGKIVNNTTESKKLTIQTSIFDKNQKIVAGKRSTVMVSPGSQSVFVQDKMEVSNPNLWSPAQPYLYRAITRIIDESKSDSVSDELSLPVGFKWFSFDGEKGFMLNGSPFKLIGANRHQDFKGKGNALTDDYHRNDYTKIKELGFNFVRLAHYPQAQEVYRTCDELGLLVWSEIPVVNEITQTQEFTDNCLNMQREQVRQTRNHPSIILYGYMNEIYIRMLADKNLTDDKRKQIADATIELAKKLNTLTKSEAPAISTVMAQHYDLGYNTYGISSVPDVIGWNLYFGWYYDSLPDLTKFLDEEHRKYPHRPMIVSEYGADADIRNHSFIPRSWDFSEEYENVLHASYLKQMLAMKYLSGFSAWNFADFGAENRTNATPFINQKGLVNYDRTEKSVCDLYRSYFSKQPVLRIASRNYTLRSGIESAEHSNYCIQPVTIFTNLKNVELRLNGKSLGHQTVTDKQTIFKVPFTQGVNLLEATDGQGKFDRVSVDFTLIPANLSSAPCNDLAVNVGAFQYFFEPQTRVLWVPDRAYTKGAWGYIGGAPYTKFDRQLKVGVANNILGTNSNPLFQTFNEGIEAYRFDVQDGNYAVTLCFVEYNAKVPAEDLVYNFSTSKDKATADVRVFNVAINGANVIDSLNLAADYGSLRAVTFEVKATASNNKGVEVRFNPVSGKAVLSGIRIKKLN